MKTESQSERNLSQRFVSHGSMRNSKTQVVIDFMNANLQRKISLTELAGLVNLSAYHLVHVFKTQTGLPPGEYLRRLRMEKARQLLATGVLSIKQVMAMAGYSNKSHFLRHFRRSFGLAPSEYRRIISSYDDKQVRAAETQDRITNSNIGYLLLIVPHCPACDTVDPLASLFESYNVLKKSS